MADNSRTWVCIGEQQRLETVHNGVPETCPLRNGPRVFGSERRTHHVHLLEMNVMGTVSGSSRADTKMNHQQPLTPRTRFRGEGLLPIRSRAPSPQKTTTTHHHCWSPFAPPLTPTLIERIMSSQ